MTDGHEWQAFIRLHQAELLGPVPQEPVQPVPAADRSWPAPRESAFLARIDPWIVPIVITLLAVIALAATAGH